MSDAPSLPSALVAPTPALLNASRFRAAHEADWRRLDLLLRRIEKGSLRSLSDEDLLALPLLYRTTVSSLSVARDTSLDRGLVSYLEQLCVRAYFQIYGVQTPVWRQFARFFGTGWPAAVRALWRETLVCLLLIGLSATVAFFLVRSNASWFYSIIPDGLAQGRDPSASAASLRATLYERHNDMLATFATYLFTHNSQVAIFAFALGFAFGLPTILLMMYNGLMLGAMLAVFAGHGLTWNFTGWLMIHGTTEILAVSIAGAAGLRIGMAIAFPGRQSRAEAAVVAGRSAATAMGGTVIMLAVAGLLEGIGRQTVVDDAPRYLIGSVMLLLWLAYFYVPRRT